MAAPDADIKEAFALHDKRGNGTIASSSLGDVLRALGQNPTQKQVQDLVNDAPQESESTRLSLYLLPALFRLTQDDFIAGFQVFDKEGNGYIGQGEFRYILTTLGEPLSDHEVDELLKDAEITPEGNLNYVAFVNRITSQAQRTAERTPETLQVMTTTTSAAAAAATSSDETIQTSQIARTRHVIVTVIGATGHQGSGVVAAFLRPFSSSSLEDGADNPEYAVRAVSSNPSGSKSQALLSAHPSAASSPRLTLVQADLANVESLKEAIRGSDGVFFAGPFMPGEGAKAEESEEAKWGRNVVDAVKACGVEHFIYSSLNHLSVLSKGKYVNVVHEDAKALVAQYAQAQLKAVTLLIPQDGAVTICVPVDPEVKMEWVDEGFDIGNFAAA
ncbi:hypothetical protein C6P46_002217 [Rhodotorula mucilaginosa]|uniref:EF-hand domain-containing protein n=1 Tax=Rhodotorula mucilaginosa TaxID=5537 RepID=A0A9P6VU21_RHOMI|nr:hypothetical protein C6P46_002217 [Rhodotorula mucilaginosa]